MCRLEDEDSRSGPMNTSSSIKQQGGAEGAFFMPLERGVTEDVLQQIVSYPYLYTCRGDTRNDVACIGGGADNKLHEDGVLCCGHFPGIWLIIR